MACACPCFGDEADAEEKPNQMIQLDGLGMLRLDTQHVGQGSQGARSAKWFYFGETDDRLAVVNMLLCITCFLMWILAIWAVSTYYPEANPSGERNNGAGKQNFNGVEEDATNNAIGSTHIDLKAAQQNYVQLEKQHKKLVATHKTMEEQFDAQQGWQTKVAELEREKKTLESEKVQLEKHLKIHKDAKNTLGTNNIELTKTVTELRESITNLNDELSSKEDLLKQYSYPTFRTHFDSNIPKRGANEKHSKEMERSRFNYYGDPVGYRKYLEDEHADALNEWLEKNKTESKDDDNTNDVGSDELSNNEQGTTEENQ